MTIQELKQQIESRNVTDHPIIFKDDKDAFISRQYISEIQKIKGIEINYISSLDEVITDSWSFFDFDATDSTTALNVLYSDVYDWKDKDITSARNLIVVVTKFSDKELEKKLSEYIVVVPKLEEWQIRDYVMSVCSGVQEKQLDWLINICGGNINRVQQELDKILLFTESERKYIFEALIRDGEFEDLSSFNVFNFSNAVLSKDITAIKSIYREIDRVDINEFGLLTILLRNFRNVIMVQLNSNPTPESTGLDSKQLYAIKKIPRVYSAEQLVKIFDLLCDIDRQIKTGELPTEFVVDYMILKILSV